MVQRVAMGSQGIYLAALQCESLFEQDIAELQSRQDRLNSKGIILAEFLQNSHARFSAWASYMGVFADPDVSLDQRLRISELIQQMVLDMLEVLHSNLDLLKALVSQMTRSALEHESSELHGSDIHELENRVQKAKESIDGSVSRLHRLGTTIRQSSTAGLASRVKAFTAKSSTTSLEKITALIVSNLHPGASTDLQKLLSRSILDRYFRLKYKQQHQRHLSQRRATPKIDEGDLVLNTRNEKTVEVQPKVLPIRTPRDSKELAPSKSHGERSKPSTLQESQVLNAIGDIEARSVATSASTVPMTDIRYPKPPKPESPWAGLTSCDWCAMAFENAKFKDPRWWRKHVDHDLKPYICLAKECLDTEVAFGRYSAWRSHMNEAHSTSWIKNVCTETQWKCDFDDIMHRDEESLKTHMKDSHQDLLTEEQIAEVASWSAIPVQPDTERCPLCQYSPLAEPDIPSASDEELKPSTSQSKSLGSIIRRPRSAGGRRKKRRRVRFHDSQPIKLEDSDSESSGSTEVDNDGSSKQPLNNRMRLERHISSHLKALSFMSLRLDAFQANEDGEDDEDAGSQKFLDDTSGSGDISGWDSNIDAMSLTFEDVGNEIELPPVDGTESDSNWESSDALPALGEMGELSSLFHPGFPLRRSPRFQLVPTDNGRFKVVWPWGEEDLDSAVYPR
uniref:C2H2-type domain-containing protein n=1 Tax=Bionectria ochroleuca TaxID=29856 RepID=A0A8H7KEP0_BIOOC